MECTELGVAEAKETRKSVEEAFGDMKESSTMLTEAKSKPMKLCHDIAPRVIPFLHQTVNIHGIYA